MKLLIYYISSTPQASKVLHSQHAAARFVTIGASSVYRKIAFKPLMRHVNVSVFVFDELFAVN